MLRNTIIAFALICCLATNVYATKPCPPSPCRNSSGKIDQKECFKHASWVATGTITNVKRDRRGHPLHKDFAFFTFNPTEWQKGELAEVSKIKFRVSWCFNQKEVPDDYSGKFKFFGDGMPTEDGANRYLDFIALEK